LQQTLAEKRTSAATEGNNGRSIAEQQLENSTERTLENYHNTSAMETQHALLNVTEFSA